MHSIPVPTPRSGEQIRPMQGVRCWSNRWNGFLVIEVHYTADPARRGDWKYQASPKYGGLKSWRWRKEQEIDWQARAGRLVFENWDQEAHVPSFPFDPPQHWPRWILVDPGWTNPTSILWVAVDIDSEPNEWGYRAVHVYREFHRRHHKASDLAHYAYEMSRPANRRGEVELEKVEEMIIDPGAKQEHQSAASPEKVDEGAEHVFGQLQAAIEELGWDLPVRTGNNHKHEAILEIIARLANYWVSSEGVPLYDEQDNFRPATDDEVLDGAYVATPTLFIHPNCPALIREMKMYVWAEWASAEVQARRNDPEKPVDKDDHGITNLIRFMNELRTLRGDTGDVMEEGLVDLEEFSSRHKLVKVETADDIARRVHEQRAGRYRKKRAKQSA